MLAALLVLAAVPQSPPGDVRDSQALYPCERADEVVRYFGLDTDAPDLGKVRAALAELGAEIAYGPRTTGARPGHGFVAVLAPASESPKKLALALKKGGGAAHELACIAFDGREGQDSNFGLGGLGFTTRDFVMGLSGEIVWYDSVGTWSQFYVEPGKIEAREIAARYEKLYAPYGGGRIGAVVRERFSWILLRAPDERMRERLLRAIRKLDGIEEAGLEGDVLTVVVRLEGLEASGAAGKLPPTDGQVFDEVCKEAPRAAFCTRALHELLAVEKLVP